MILTFPFLFFHFLSSAFLLTCNLLTLPPLQETDDFTKTACYHYFHLSCLERYVEFFWRQEEERRRSQEDMDLMLRKKPKQVTCHMTVGGTCSRGHMIVTWL